MNFTLADGEEFLDRGKTPLFWDEKTLRLSFMFRPAPSVLVINREIIFNISLLDNSFSITVESADDSYTTDTILDLLRIYDFWFAIYANCPCNNSVNSLDIEANYDTNKFQNIGVEQEAVWLVKTNYKLHVSLHPQEKLMRVTKLVEDENGDWLDNSDEIKLPLIDLDWSQEQLAVDKIKLLMTFS